MKSIYDKIWKRALNILQRRFMSRADLRRKLQQKYPEENGYIEQILDEMERVGLINDHRYTEQLLQYLTQKPIGRFKIILETKKRGLNPDIVQAILMSTDYNEKQMCKQAYQEKNKILQDSDSRRRKQKMMTFLRNRGFAYNIIYSVLK